MHYFDKNQTENFDVYRGVDRGMYMLKNTVYRLNHDRALTVGFFGGSITEGAGSSDPTKTSWAGRTAEWLKNKYPNADLDFRNRAIGGTGSDFGVYRRESELMPEGESLPQLYFIEFAVNDYGWVYESIHTSMECIVRKIWSRCPTADIVFVYTMTKFVDDDVRAGAEFESRAAHSAVAHYYGIPSVSIGDALRSAVWSEHGGDWLALTADNVHPNDDGYAVCAEAVFRLLTSELDGDTPDALEEKQLPPYRSIYDQLEARVVDSSEAAASSGWSYHDSPLGHYPHYYEASVAGEWMELRFVGRRVGLYVTLTPDSNLLRWQIDGGEPLELTCCRRPMQCALPCELEYGEHTVRVYIDGEAGTAVEPQRISAFLIS